MTVTKLAALAGLALLGFFCWLAAAGFTAMTALLVTGAALVVLVGGGNWLGGRGTPPAHRAAGRGRRDRAGADPPADPGSGSDPGLGPEAGAP